MPKLNISLSLKGIDYRESIVGLIRFNLEDSTKKVVGIHGLFEIPGKQQFILYNDDLKNFFYYGTLDTLRQNYHNQDTFKKILEKHQIEETPIWSSRYKHIFLCIPLPDLQLADERVRMLEEFISNFYYFADKLVERVEHRLMPQSRHAFIKAFAYSPPRLVDRLKEKKSYYTSHYHRSLEDLEAIKRHSTQPLCYTSESRPLACYQDLL